MSRASARLRFTPMRRDNGPMLQCNSLMADGAASSGPMKTSVTARLSPSTLISTVVSTLSCAARYRPFKLIRRQERLPISLSSSYLFRTSTYPSLPTLNGSKLLSGFF